MIPVIVTDKDGKLSSQVFNDNLSAVEQINRILLDTTVYAQTKLVNDKDAFARKVSASAMSDAQIEAIKEAAKTMQKAVHTAIDTFAGVVAAN